MFDLKTSPTHTNFKQNKIQFSWTILFEKKKIFYFSFCGLISDCFTSKRYKFLISKMEKLLEYHYTGLPVSPMYFTQNCSFFLKMIILKVLCHEAEKFCFPRDPSCQDMMLGDVKAPIKNF